MAFSPRVIALPTALQTRIRNFQNPSLLEVIAKPIPGIQYGDELDVLVNRAEISIHA